MTERLTTVEEALHYAVWISVAIVMPRHLIVMMKNKHKEKSYK